MTEITYILSNFKSKGFRITKARKSIISIFLNSKTPLSVPELLILLEKMNVKVNKTTVYREIDFLKGQKMVREIQLGDRKSRYEIWHDDHHHHLVCIQCNSVECVELKRCLESEERRLSEENNFQVIKHSLEFFGLCARCQ